MSKKVIARDRRRGIESVLASKKGKVGERIIATQRRRTTSKKA